MEFLTQCAHAFQGFKQYRGCPSIASCNRARYICGNQQGSLASNTNLTPVILTEAARPSSEAEGEQGRVEGPRRCILRHAASRRFYDKPCSRAGLTIGLRHLYATSWRSPLNLPSRVAAQTTLRTRPECEFRFRARRKGVGILRRLVDGERKANYDGAGYRSF